MVNEGRLVGIHKYQQIRLCLKFLEIPIWLGGTEVEGHWISFRCSSTDWEGESLSHWEGKSQSAFFSKQILQWIDSGGLVKVDTINELHPWSRGCAEREEVIIDHKSISRRIV